MSEIRYPLAPLLIKDAFTGERRPHRVTLFPYEPAGPQKGKMRAVFGPSPSKGTSDWRCPPGTEENTRRVLNLGRSTDLMQALVTAHKTDVHAVFYVAYLRGTPVPQAPRVAKTAPSGFEWMRSFGYHFQWDCVPVDIDNPGDHAVNTTASLEEWVAQLSNRPELDGCLWYPTRGGARVVLPLREAVAYGDHFERMMDALRSRILLLGIKIGGKDIIVDSGCKDCTRFMRMPNARRDGKQLWEHLTDLSEDVLLLDAGGACPTEIDPSVLVEPRRSVTRESAQRSPKPFVSKEELPPDISIEIPDITTAMIEKFKNDGGCRHSLLLHIPASLLQCGLAPEYVTAVVREIAIRSWPNSGRLDEFIKGSESTIELWRNRQPVKGMREEAPEIYHAISVFSLGQKQRRLRRKTMEAEADPAAAGLSANEAVEQLGREMVAAAAGPAGWHMFGGACGMGKTSAIVEFARTMVRKGKRVGVATHSRRNAVDVFDRAADVPRLRVFSPTSERVGKDGPYVCKHRDKAVALQRGGHNVYFELCSGRAQRGTPTETPCPELAAGCPAAQGHVADGGQMPDAVEGGVMVVGTHAAIPTIAPEVDCLILDESMEITTSVSIDEKDITAALDALPRYYTNDYCRSVTPALHAIYNWIHDGDVSRSFLDVLGDTVVSLRDAPCVLHGVPPLRHGVSSRVRALAPALGEQIGRTSETLHALWGAVTYDSKVELLSDWRDPDRHTILIVTGERRIHPANDVDRVFVLDADYAVQAPWYTKLLGGQGAKCHPMVVRDGAEARVSREMLWDKDAIRSKSMAKHGALLPDGAWIRALRRAADLCQETPDLTRILIGAYKVVCVAIRFACGDGDPGKPAQDELLAAWRHMGQAIGSLPAIVEALRPVMQSFPARPDVLHYGATRGVDDYKTAQITISIHEQVAPRDVARCTADLWEIDEDAAERDMELRAAAETGQLHGRARVPRRSDVVRQIHIGKYVPSEWVGKHIKWIGERPAEARERGAHMGAEHGKLGAKFGHMGAEHGLKGGRPKNDNAMTAAAFKVVKDNIGTSKLAKAIGKSENAVRAYAAGLVGIPASVANDVALLIAGSVD